MSEFNINQFSMKICTTKYSLEEVENIIVKSIDEYFVNNKAIYYNETHVAKLKNIILSNLKAINGLDKYKIILCKCPHSHTSIIICNECMIKRNIYVKIEPILHQT